MKYMLEIHFDSDIEDTGELLDKIEDSLSGFMEIDSEELVEKWWFEGKKQCATCRGWFEIDEFHRDTKRPDGRRDSCKQCICAYEANRKLKKNKEQMMWAAMDMGGMLK